MGVVYQAEHRRMHRVVALKVLAASAMKSPAAVQRFHREVEAAAKLEHPNIVTAYDADEAGGVHFLVMQFVEGTDLASLVKDNGPLPVDKAIHCVLQAARGLEYAHEQGVVHRDIKPSNLMLDKRGAVKILDMGLARLAGESESGRTELTASGEIMGTVDYMAPEQALDTHAADARSDIYSLGMTLWYLLTGRPAYVGATVMSRMLAHREAPLPSLSEACPGAPKALEGIIEKMAAKKPAYRYQSLGEVIAPLERCLESDASAPSVSIGHSEDSRLDDFFRSLQGRGKSTAGAAAGGAKQAVHAEDAIDLDRTVALNGATQDTDPQTNVSLGRATQQKKRKPRSASHSVLRDPRLWAIYAAGITLTLVLGGVLIKIINKDDSVKEMNTPDAANPAPRSSSVADAWKGWPKDAPPPAIAPFDAEQAKQHQVAWAEHLGAPVEHVNSIDMTFRLIPPGEFVMGNTEAEIAAALALIAPRDRLWREAEASNKPRHRVIVSRAFYLAVHEVTQAEYDRVMQFNPSFFAAGGEKGFAQRVANLDTTRHPVENVELSQALEFCNRLSALEALNEEANPAGDGLPRGYRLPTEAEWEWACRGGSTGAPPSGASSSDRQPLGWLRDNSQERTHPVAQYGANSFGLHDLYGNVWEWVWDGWRPDDFQQYAAQTAVDPKGAARNATRQIARGGSWTDLSPTNQSPSRNSAPKTHRWGNWGFRVALSVDAVKRSQPAPRTQSSIGHALEFNGRSEM
jgi:serine/threonine protein kinase/formylglycine-generating enzyme required for sulfatase activity